MSPSALLAVTLAAGALLLPPPARGQGRGGGAEGMGRTQIAVSTKAPPWVPMVAALATIDAATLDIQSADAALQRLAFIGPAPACEPRIVVPPNGVAHLNAIFVGACNTHAPVLNLQLLIQPAPPAAIADLVRRITATAGPPCFDGVYQPNPRRRAPPQHFTAWVSPQRDLVLTQDSSMPGALSVALINKAAKPDPDQAPGYTGLLQMVENALPDQCRQ